MKAVIMRGHLRDALLRAGRASGDNEKLPVLKCVLLEATEHNIVITGTNLEIAITTSFPGKIIEKGKIAVPLAVLSQIVGSLQGERLNIEYKNNTLELIGDNYKAALKGTSADEFPIIPKIENQKEHIKIQGGPFVRALNQALAATQPSDTRPELNSILFDFGIDAIKIAGTDGFRLAEKTIGEKQFSSTNQERFKVLIPLKTAIEVARIVGDGEEVMITRDASQISFATEHTECISRLTQGTFPEYQAIIPKKFAAEIIMDKDEFLSAIKLVSALVGRTYEITLRCAENKKAVELHSRDQSLGDNTYTLSAKISGEMKDVIFNWRYLSDAVKLFDPGDVFLGIAENDLPSLLRPKKDDAYFYIVKPIARQ